MSVGGVFSADDKDAAFQFAWDILPSLASFALMCKTEEMGGCAANW